MKKAYARSILLPREGEHVGSGIQAPKTPCKAAGLREPEASQPCFARPPLAGWVPKRLACFPEHRRGGAGVCCPKSVSSPFADCSAQELGWCRWGDGASGLSGPAGLGGHCWGICAKGLRTPNHASPQRRIHWVWVSGSRDPQQREGPGSPRQPIPAFPDVQRQSGCENGLRYFLEQRRGGAVIAP